MAVALRRRGALAARIAAGMLAICQALDFRNGGILLVRERMDLPPAFFKARLNFPFAIALKSWHNLD